MPGIRRLWPALVVTGVLAVGHAGAAQAQIINPLGVNNNNTLTKSDYSLANAAAKKLLDEPPALGRYEDWRNPASGNSGKLTIIDIFTQNSLPCRKVSSRIEFAKKGAAPNTLVLDACQIPSGQWKVAS